MSLFRVYTYVLYVNYLALDVMRYATDLVSTFSQLTFTLWTDQPLRFGLWILIDTIPFF